jgi:hypothetical protein
MIAVPTGFGCGSPRMEYLREMLPEYKRNRMGRAGINAHGTLWSPGIVLTSCSQKTVGDARADTPHAARPLDVDRSKADHPANLARSRQLRSTKHRSPDRATARTDSCRT